MALGQAGGDLQIGLVEEPVQVNAGSRKRLTHRNKGGFILAIMVQNFIGRDDLFTEHLYLFPGRAGPMGSGSHDHPDVLRRDSQGPESLQKRGKNSGLPLVGYGAGDVGYGDGHDQALRVFPLSPDDLFQGGTRAGLVDGLLNLLRRVLGDFRFFHGQFNAVRGNGNDQGSAGELHLHLFPALGLYLFQGL